MAPPSDGVVVTQPPEPLDAAARAAREWDAVAMTADERRWGRRRVTTRRGRTLALALPTGTVLRPGDVLCATPDWYVVVEAAAEAVLAATPASHPEALRVAFEVGNRHFALALDGERLLVPDDPAMTQLLTRLGVPFEATRAVFEPVGAPHRHPPAASAPGHAH